MLRKALAGVLGVFVALGSYALIGVLSPAPASLDRAAPMQPSAVKLPAAKIHVVDPTPVRLVISAISVDARIHYNRQTRRMPTKCEELYLGELNYYIERVPQMLCEET